MQYKIKYSPYIAIDIYDIWQHIALVLKNPNAANRIVDNINEKMAYVEEFPFAGSKYYHPDYSESEYRFAIVNSYKIFYKIENKTILFERVLYSKRNHERLFFSVKELASQSFE